MVDKHQDFCSNSLLLSVNKIQDVLGYGRFYFSSGAKG